jgi:Fe-S cluster biogenesis protein NfuA
VELVNVENGVVSVRLTGACGSCPMSTVTLRMGLERLLRKAVPEMTELVAV